MHWAHHHRRAEDFPGPWLQTVEDSFRPWGSLGADERSHLIELTWELIERKNWEAAQGFELTDEMKVTIAVHASMLILALDHRFYRNVGAVIVHPTSVVLKGQRAGPVSGVVTDSPMPILGEARQYGPVVIAWDSAREEARHPERGHNVIYHEFAHKLDMLTGSPDGTPPLPTPEEASKWMEVCAREYELLVKRKGGHLLRPYGAVNRGEFFAVVTEVFFDKPIEMQREKTALYEVLRSFYRQDPASWGRSGQA